MVYTSATPQATIAITPRSIAFLNSTLEVATWLPLPKIISLKAFLKGLILFFPVMCKVKKGRTLSQV
jgi:hypothetical protein